MRWLSGLSWIVLISLGGCSPPQRQIGNGRIVVIEKNGKAVVETIYAQAQHLGHGVYIFHIDGDPDLWDRSLIKFRKDHPSLTITSQGIRTMELDSRGQIRINSLIITTLKR